MTTVVAISPSTGRAAPEAAAPRSRWRRLTLVAVALVAAVAAAAYYVVQVQLPHYREVREGVLYRSGQPRGVGLSLVKAHGIRTIVNVRQPGSEGVAEEAAFAEENGIHFHNFNIGKDEDAARESIARFLAIVDDPDNWPVLVHCSRGKERSGAMSAAFRIARDGWTADEALAEAEEFGLGDDRLLRAKVVLRELEAGTLPSAPALPSDDADREARR